MYRKFLFLINLFALYLGIIISNQAYAFFSDEQDSCCIEQLDYCCEPQPCSWHFKKELLWWTADEDGLEFATRHSDVLTTNDFRTKHLHDPDFHWEYGFRLQGGYTPACSLWTFSLSWANITNKATGTLSGNSGAPDFEGIFPIWSMSPNTLIGDYTSTAKLHWHLTTNIIDLDAEYGNFCFWNRLNLVPQVGLRCAILHQKLRVKYEGGTFFSGVDDNVMRNRFIGFGPRFGGSGSYYLFKGISLQGLIAGTPMYGHFYTSHREFYLENKQFTDSHTLNRFVMSFDYKIGVQWQGKTLDCWPDVILAAGWEGHTFYRQNQMERGDYGFFKKDRDLTLEGWTFSASFCF